MYFNNDCVCLRISIPLKQFEELGQAHLEAYPTTPTLEAEGRSFVKRGLPEAEVYAFVQAVCVWGGYPGIAGRVCKNTPAKICERFRRAVERLDANSSEVGAGLAEVNALPGLGQPSFASKHLRFMRPELCPVFDSRLQTALPYPGDPLGYSMFARDCKSLADALTGAKVPNPRKRKWLVADAEAALYAFVTGLRTPAR